MIQLRRDTAANWTTANPVLGAGQPGYETDTRKLKFGDGATAWNSLAYSAVPVAWGDITGTLSAQTDLQAALDAKQATLVSATNIKTVNGTSLLGAGDVVISGSALSDGDYGDITVSGTGTAMAIDAGAVSLAKMANMATASLIYRKTAGAGAPEVNTLVTLKTDLGLTGTNSGDQTSIVGITGTKAQFDTAVTDGNVQWVGDAPTAHTHLLAAGATDVTVTAANLNALDDGVNTALHFHDADRDRANHTGTQLAATISDFSTAVAATAAVTANTAKVTNATHTGDVTGDTALTIAARAVTWAKVQAMATARFLGRVTAGSGDVEELTAAQVKTALAIANTDVSGLGTLSTQSGTFSGTSSGTNTGDQNLFSTIAVSGQSNVVADATSDTLTLVAGSNITITTNAATDEITIAAAGGGATNLSYTAATRIIASDTGTDATLPLMSSGDAGLVPASGGGTTTFLRADGTFAAPGGGGSPGGSTTQVQYNSAGAFAGATEVEIENGQLRLEGTTSLTAPASGGVKVIARTGAGRTIPAFLSQDGLMREFQDSLAFGHKMIWKPQTGVATFQALGGAVPSGTGTTTLKNWAATNLYTRWPGIEYLVTVASATAVAGFRSATPFVTANGGSSGTGGFYLCCVWGPATGVATATTRAAVGMVASTVAPTDVDPSTLVSCVFMGWDAADTNIQIMSNDSAGTCTKVDLGASFPVPTTDRANVYQLELYAPQGTSRAVNYLVTDKVSGATASGVITTSTDLPATSASLVPKAYMSAGGTSSVIGITLFSLYLDSLL